MNKNKVLVSLIVVLLLTNLAVLYYFTKYLPDQKKNASRSEWVIRTLHLDSTQSKEYKALRNMRDSILTSYKSDYKDSRMKIRDLVSLDNVNDSLIHAVADSIVYAQKPIEVEMIKHYLRVKSILNPEQYQYLDSSLVKMINFNSSDKKPNTTNK